MFIFKRNLPLVAFAVFAFLPAASFAEEPGCAEAMRAASFDRQMQLTDGDVSPEVEAPAQCKRTVLARSADDDENQLYREWGIVEAETE